MAAVPKLRPLPLGKLIDGMWAAREKKRALDAQLKTIEDDIKVREEELLARLDQEGLDKSTGKAATASISSNVSASITDWDAFCLFVKKSGNFQLFQKRISDPAARELFESKGQVPGLVPFTKRKLNLRSL